jgi:hypothetical protein
MKKAYQYPITIATDICAMGVLMASKTEAGGDPKTPPGFAPRHGTQPF